METGSAKGVLGCLSFLETQRQKSREQPPSRVQELRDRVEELKKKRERLRHQIQVHQVGHRGFGDTKWDTEASETPGGTQALEIPSGTQRHQVGHKGFRDTRWDTEALGLWRHQVGHEGFRVTSPMHRETAEKEKCDITS
uniref:Uncharacterized protein n=1 Tax=Knipowitschia caucasica TaxID=637954 RepID=A0AAV2JKB7_KNICA